MKSIKSFGFFITFSLLLLRYTFKPTCSSLKLAKMKRCLLFLSFLGVGSFVMAQQSLQAENQNPDYNSSRQKYMASRDKLLTTMGTTVQDTNKAYDWYEAKQERKQQRYLDRRERRMYQKYYPQYDSYRYYRPYSNYNRNYYRNSPYRQNWYYWFW